MANVAHATLTGSNLHEPKGVASAAAGTVYIANGSGSGDWTVSGTVVSGMIADFATPIAPSGWLELDGSDISTATFAALYTVMTIQQSGARGSGSPIITNLTSTTNMRPGYFVFGTGITSGTTILTVDSATQITMSANAVSSGTATVIVSPWLLNTNTIRLPDTTTAGRFRRSRTSAVHMGASQADLLKNHTHTGTSGTESASHNHTVNLTDPGHSHSADRYYDGAGAARLSSSQTIDVSLTNATSTNTTGISVSSVGTESATHTHTTITGNPDGSLGGTETRPLTLVLMTCVKT